MSDDMGVVSLGRDGVISKWTRTNQNHWQWAKLLDAGKEDSICFAYKRDRIAVAFPRIGVKVWIWIKGTWQPQRSILRQNVTSIQFVEDGEALIGGTSDGVLWYCQVPNGTLRAYAFLKAKVYHLDVSGPGTHALVSQAGGRAHLVGIQQTDHRGKIEQVYSTNENPSGEQRLNFGAVFASSCKTVLFGSTEGNLLVWDKSKGEVICALDHGESEEAQAVASFDRGPQAWIVTGTKRGVLSWWKPPLMES
ncbi:WD40-repeat-containing domain protein [Boletus coccyginus]|nr:WD40-repeat-containing domain protein [Boletus coccyginus]